MNRFPRRVVNLAVAILLAGCSNGTPEAGFVTAQPSTEPARPSTPFTAGLSCLDTLLRTQPNPLRGGRLQPISVGLIPDATGRINPGLRDMVSAAAFSATSGSQRFTLIEAAMVAGPGGLPAASALPTGMGVILGPSGGGPAEVTANAPGVRGSYQIIGSLTQADKGVQQSQTSLGLSERDNTASAASTWDFGTIVLDLRLVQVANGLVLQQTRNGLAVRNNGFALNAALKLGSFGISLDYSVDKREGPHQAISTLVDLSVIELVGRQAGVPYWQCLSIDRDHPVIRAQAREWFERMDAAARDAYARERLGVLGYKVPDAPAAMTEALMAFQNNNGLIPVGRLTFDTFSVLVANARPADTPSGQIPPTVPVASPATPRSLSLAVRESADDSTLWLEIGLDRASYLSCFYRDEHGRILRLYPNAAQSRARVRADVPFAIPPAERRPPFVIKPDAMTADLGFLCLATERDVTGELPPELRAGSFQQVGASNFETIIAAYRAAAGPDLAIRSTTRGQPDGRWDRM